MHGDEFKIAITAPPVDGKANSLLVKYLSKAFKVTNADVVILKGMQGRHKQVKISMPKHIPTEVSRLL